MSADFSLRVERNGLSPRVRVGNDEMMFTRTVCLVTVAEKGSVPDAN